MSRIVVMGAGVVGLSTALLLAKDGHDVVVVERDVEPPAASPSEAWSSWQRRGVNQFRLPHFLLGRYRQILDDELPEVAAALEADGALRTNAFLSIPESVRGDDDPGDGDFEVLTARRPVFESVLARVVVATDGVEVRRGTTVESLVFDGGSDDVAHVVGVRTEDGTELRGDLVVDLTGRRSALPRLLDGTSRGPIEELDDSGFLYLARHLQSADGSVPFALGPALMDLGTVSALTLAADNGTWGLVLVASAKDRPLLGLRDPDRWAAAFGSLPLMAHWLDGTPIDDGVTTMSKIEDRIRTYVVDGEPVVTGVVAVGDAWACSNPTHGRGVSIGALHGLALRDTIRDVGLGEPETFALAFHEATETRVRPWFEWTRRQDRHRLAEIDAMIDGREYEPDDAEWTLEKELSRAAGSDPDLLRALLRANFVLESLDVSMTTTVRDRVRARGADWRQNPLPAPDRATLVAMATG